MRADARVQEICIGHCAPPVIGRSAVAEGERRTVLRFQEVDAFYGKSRILNDASLDVREGAIAALLGRNGPGKGTLPRSARGQPPPASGAIEFDGLVIAGLPAPEVARPTDGRSGTLWLEAKIYEVVPKLKVGIRARVHRSPQRQGRSQFAAVPGRQHAAGEPSRRPRPATATPLPLPCRLTATSPSSIAASTTGAT